MKKLLIKGGKRLEGSVSISGAKNAAVAILPAALLADTGVCHIENLPCIEDIACLEKIIEGLGVKIEETSCSDINLYPEGMKSHICLMDEVRKMRGSSYLMGTLLGRFGKAELLLPGGCDLGVRPIDQHIKGFEALGAKVTIEHGKIKMHAEHGLKGANVFFDVSSVGATINVMLAACKAEGLTVLENVAKEPHVVDVANFLNTMGANIKGAGTDVIKITGVKSLRGCTYSVIPDQIEAGTYMVAAAATRGDVTLLNVIPKHLESITAKLLEMGVDVEEGEDTIRVMCNRRTSGANVKTLPYPGFPTDLQQPMTVLFSVSKGRSTVIESIWESRFKYVDELKRMGANIKVEGKMAVVDGVERLTGAHVIATDLRGGAAMVVAGLIADGYTCISDIHHIERGYERIHEKLRGLGADIEKIDE